MTLTLNVVNVPSVQATNGALHLGEGILRGRGFLRRFRVSRGETVHPAGIALPQSALQADPELRRSFRSESKDLEARDEQTDRVRQIICLRANAGRLF